MSGKGLFDRWVIVWVVVLSLVVLAACSDNNAISPTVSGEYPAPKDSIGSNPDDTQFEGGDITVYAAASLTNAFQEIGAKFESVHPGVKVRFSFAGSQVLRTQIEQGGIVDIFTPADQQNMDQLISENLIDASSVRIIASNRLILILPEENYARIESLHDLARPGTKLVVADALVPAGNYTRLVISQLSEDPAFGASFYNAVLENVVSNETDVRQVVTKVELGEADAGIVYASDAVFAKHIRTVDIPEEFNIIAEYPMGILTRSKNSSLAAAFVDFVNSTSGQESLNRWGFVTGK